jgi:hypothetical protein
MKAVNEFTFLTDFAARKVRNKELQELVDQEIAKRFSWENVNRAVEEYLENRRAARPAGNTAQSEIMFPGQLFLQM